MGGWAYRGVGDEIEEGNMRGREGGKSKGSVWLEIERRFPLKKGGGRLHTLYVGERGFL